MIEGLAPDNVPPASGPYTPGIRVGNLLFLSGQGPFDAEGRRVGETFAEQVRQTLGNLEKVAQEAGTSLRNAVRVGAFLSSLDYFDEFNAVYSEFVEPPLPARTTVPAALRGFDVEIDAVVYIPGEA